eukprot:3592578-Rhodomonas_salina.1
MPLNQVSDYDLAEYLVGTSTQLTLPASYWPNDGGSWVVECIDAHQQDNKAVVVCSLQNGPKSKEKGML